MMSHAWPIVLRGGLLDLRGLPPLYALMVASHRCCATRRRFLHLVALAATPAAARAGAAVPARGLAAQARARWPRRRAGARVAPAPVARYYVLTQACIAAGLWDHLRHGTPAGWAPPEGTR